MLTEYKTKQQTLEEIAAAFGDKVVDVKDEQVSVDALVAEDKVKAGHVENKV